MALEFNLPNSGNLRSTFVDEIFAIVNAVFEVLRLVDRKTVSLHWVVKLQVEGPTVRISPRSTEISTSPNPNFQQFIPRVQILSQAFRFRQWLRPSVKHQTAHLRSWELYQKYTVLCKDLFATGILGKPFRVFGEFDTFKRARIALSNRDHATLARLIDQTWNCWTEHKAAVADMDAHLQARYGPRPSRSGHGFDPRPLDLDRTMLFRDYQYDFSRFDVNGWMLRLDKAVLTECGVFMTGTVKRTRWYELLTPKMVRALHDFARQDELARQQQVEEEAAKARTEGDKGVGNEVTPIQREMLHQTKLVWRKGAKRLGWRR